MDARTVRRTLIILSVVLSAAASSGGEGLEDAIDATVYLEVQRLFSGRLVATSGTAFFVHPKGYLLTNAHVVSDTVGYPDGREVNARVLKVRAIVNSGGPGEREVKATIVATDRENDLALLKAEFSPATWLDLDASRVPSVTEQIWVVGFPLGDFLGLYDERTDQVNRPTVSVNGGRVTSLRKDSASVLKVIQMDAAVNFGNSGGPLVDDDGAPLGIVTAKIGGAAGLGFAIPALEIDSFLEKQAFVTRFVPAVIYHGMPPLQISVTPVFSDVIGLSGTITIDGGDTKPMTASLRPSGQQLTAAISLQDEHAEAAVGGSLLARITVTREGGVEAMHRVFRLRASGGVAEHASDTTVGSADDTTSVQRTASLGGALGGGKFAGARSSTGTGSNGVVISDELMAKLHEFRFSEELYAELPNPSHRSLAEQYDRTSYRLYRLLVKLGQTDRRNREVTDEIREQIETVLEELSKMQSDLREREICRCGSRWKLCSDSTCHDPEKPWLDDDLGEIRAEIKNFTSRW